jgi:adenosylcobyric acid synthase
MLQGTAPAVGNSVLVAALCRFFQCEGVSVAPFRTHSVSTDSVTLEGDVRLGSAQVLQAFAAQVKPSVEMNPIQLRAEAAGRLHVTVMGRSLGSLTAREYGEHRVELEEAVERCLATLRSGHDLVLIDGSVGPAALDLGSDESSNFHAARVAEAAVLLVGDAGAALPFASLVGALDVLEDAERDRVAALVVNKLRGSPEGVRSGLEFLQEKTGKPLLGLVPYVPGLRPGLITSQGITAVSSSLDADHDRLAQAVRDSVDTDLLWRVSTL